MKKTIGFITILILITTLFAQAQDPQPGEVFKEFFAKDFSMYKNKVISDSSDVIANIDDLEYAVRAELSVIESHAHIGTSDRSFRANNGKKRTFYKPDTPNDGYCYHYQLYGRAATGIPVSELKEGDNTVRLYLSKQLCYGFDWPGWGAMGGIVIRVYYDPAKKAHPEGEIIVPILNSEITDHLLINVDITENHRKIVSVDLIGNYFGYPFDGTDKFQNWHYHCQTGSAIWHGQVGRKTRPPYNFYWDLKWIPDQEIPIKIAARLMDDKGISFITPAVEGLKLIRKNNSVKMYVCKDLPERFQSRLSEQMSCKILIPDDIENVKSAMLQSIIWPGHLEGQSKSTIGLNGSVLETIQNTDNKIDRLNYFSYDMPVPIGILRSGENDFFIFSDTHGHMTEVYWPGPAILVKRTY